MLGVGAASRVNQQAQDCTGGHRSSSRGGDRGQQQGQEAAAGVLSVAARGAAARGHRSLDHGRRGSSRSVISSSRGGSSGNDSRWWTVVQQQGVGRATSRASTGGRWQAHGVAVV